MSSSSTDKLGSYAAHAKAGIDVLLANWRSDLLNMPGSQWWNKAISLQAILDYLYATGSEEYLNFANECYSVFAPFMEWVTPAYYDDEAWWALAWTRGYELTVKRGAPNQKYLDSAISIFDDMTSGWDNTCSGGLWFMRDPPRYGTGNFKGSIQNEQFLALACRLHLATRPTGDDTYLDWARKTWTWFRNSGMINDRHLINNGLDKNCRNDQGIAWTYTQGVILGGLVDLAAITSDATLLAEAQAIADAAISTLCYPDGVLREPCEAAGNCDEDQKQFKGIFMRNLATLWAASAAPQKAAYEDFICRNADSIWSIYGAAHPQFGLTWNRRDGTTGYIVQTSAIQALVAAVPFDGARNANY